MLKLIIISLIVFIFFAFALSLKMLFGKSKEVEKGCCSVPPDEPGGNCLNCNQTHKL